MSATGITITKAIYGAGTTVVDVTATVASNVSEGKINLLVSPDSLGVADPSPGNTKTLTVTYKINNGKSNTQAIQDNGMFTLNAPTATEATGLEITQANYGYTGNMTDVTDALKRHIKDGSIKVKVSSKTMGITNPTAGQTYSLVVDYTLNGAGNSETIPDGSTFAVSAPPAEGVSNTTAKDNTVSLFYIIWRSIVNFFFMAMYVISIYTLADYGAPTPIVTSGTELSVASAKAAVTDAFTTEAGRMRLLWMGMGAVFPYVAFWGLPTYVFWRRLFSSTDLI